MIGHMLGVTLVIQTYEKRRLGLPQPPSAKKLGKPSAVTDYFLLGQVFMPNSV